MIYVLKLEHGKFYVGYSARDVGDRFAEHFSNEGALWTKKYQPLEVLHIYHEGTLEQEDQLTLQYMQKYGWWNVRGGKWCAVEMQSPPVELITDDIIIQEPIQKPQPQLQQRGFFGTLLDGINVHIEQIRLNNQKKIMEIEEITGICGRCGRNSHLSKNCYAKTHLNTKKKL